jgi:hypothetical protein
MKLSLNKYIFIFSDKNFFILLIKMDIPLTNSQTQSFFKPTSLITSPLRDINFYDTPQIKQDHKYISTTSPNFINHQYDWVNLIPTPLNPNKIASPYISAIQNKISMTNFVENTESILNDMSPFKSIASPTIEYKNTIDKEIPKEQNDYKHKRIGCFKNLTKHFENNNCNSNSNFPGWIYKTGIHIPKKVTPLNKPIEIVQQCNENINISNISYQFQQLKELFSQSTNSSCLQSTNDDYSISEFIKNENNNSSSYTLNTFNFGLADNYKINQNINNNNTHSKFNTNKSFNSLKKYIYKQTNNHSVVKCKCSKSQCLKLYCECFANGRTCNNCFCVGCCNTEENSVKRDAIYKKIILKNPKALIKIKSSKKSWTCKCKNSNCQKNYCECYQNGKSCSTKCKCIDCKNKSIHANKKRNDRKTKTLLQKKTKRRVTRTTSKSSNSKNKVVYSDLSYKNDFIYTPIIKNYRHYNKSGLSTNADTQKNRNNNTTNNIKQEELSSKQFPNPSYKKLDLNIDESKIQNGLFLNK